MNDFLSPFVEDLARELLIRDMGCSLAGRWWHKTEEIDCVGFNEITGNAVYCEVKWRSKKTAPTVLHDLVRKSDKVGLKDITDRKFLIISKAGFTDSMMKMAIDDDNLILMDEDRFASSIYQRK